MWDTRNEKRKRESRGEDGRVEDGRGEERRGEERMGEEMTGWERRGGEEARWGGWDEAAREKRRVRVEHIELEEEDRRKETILHRKE